MEAIRTLAPDLVFLDVQMPGLTGLDVVREVGPEAMPVTVFVTAFDQHALAAFDLAALDYLLKPFEDERFHRAFARAADAVRLRQVGAVQDQLRALLTGDTPETPSPKPVPGYLERIAVEMRGQLRVVPVERIEYIAADGPYAELHAGADTFVIRERMQTLEDRLDPGPLRPHPPLDDRPARPRRGPAHGSGRRLRGAAHRRDALARQPVPPRRRRRAPRHPVKQSG